MTSTEPSASVIPAIWTTRRVILATLVVLLVVIGFLLVIVFSGIVVSMAMAPSVDWLNRCAGTPDRRATVGGGPQN